MAAHIAYSETQPVRLYMRIQDPGQIQVAVLLRQSGHVRGINRISAAQSDIYAQRAALFVILSQGPSS